MANKTVYPYGTDGQLPSSIGIINDPTTGGADKALSAEQGKVLNERLVPIEVALDIESNSELITRQLTPTEIGDNKGYMAQSKIVPSSSANEMQRYSNPIHLKTGDVLYIKASTWSSAYRLAKYVEGETNNALQILQGASSSWSDVIETTYTATEEFDALIGWYWQGDIEVKITRREDVATSKLDDLESDVNGMVNVLVYSNESTTENESIALTENTGYYQNSSGQPATIATGDGYRYSNFFNVKAGDVLNIDVVNVATSVGVLMRNEASGVRIITKGTNNTQHITFTVPYDAQYAVGWLASTGITITKVVTTVGSSERLDDIEADTALIAPLSQDVTNLNDANFEVVNDDLTTGIVTGKYIAHDGSFGTNESFAYKEISVKAGAVINYTASVHPNLAAIAEKIPNTTKYKELIPATQQAVQSFTYTATKDMTIAVSFGNGSTSTHTITISTTMPTSNRQNIENIFASLNVKHYVDFGLMFDKIAVLGDSLASGRVEGIVGQPDAAGADYYNFSWLAFLAKRWRCASFKNYSSAGATTASWIQDWLPVMQADATVYDAYFIALGTNNEYNESSPSGANYEAFVQRFNDIIDAVRAKAPHAVIFIMSLYEIRAGNATLEDIAETRMATDDGVFYVDYANQAEYFRYSPEINWRGHFSSTGYAYVAEAINKIVNGVVWDNQQEEFWQQFAKYHNGN